MANLQLYRKLSDFHKESDYAAGNVSDLRIQMASVQEETATD